MAWTSDNTTARHSVNTPAWLLAGLVVITISTVLLDVAARRGLDTGNGVLLRLIHPWAGPLLDRVRVAQAWLTASLPKPESRKFLIGFHVFVGRLMALAYGQGEGVHSWKPWIKGLAFTGVVYAAHAFFLSPF